MAPGVLVTGQGTYSYGSFHFRPGFTPCDDENVLAAVQREGLSWVEVADQSPDRPLPTPDEVQKAESDEHTGRTLTREDMKRTGYACRAPGCEKVLANAGGRTTHEKTKHPEFTPPEEGSS